MTGDVGERPQTVTLLYVDLADSTHLVRDLGDEYPRLLRVFHTLVGEATSERHGRVGRTEGDRVLCVFTDPLSAVTAAHDIQSRMATTDWQGDARPLARIGLHTGATTIDLVGPEVDRAQAISEAAQAGQVLVSETTRHLVEDELRARGWGLWDLGAFSLPGRAESERLIRIDFPDVPSAIIPPRARPKLASRVPLPATRIVGRADDIDGVAELLRRSHLVTITGPGGIGKTRLAVEIAHRLEAEFADGAVFVDLAAVRDPEQVPVAVARALGIFEGPDRGVLEALESVAGDAELLVVLDNMEQVEDAARPVGHFVDAMPHSKILVTSRSPLRSSREQEYPLAALPVPAESATEEEIARSEAVTLLRERAAGVRPDFEITPDNRAAVAEITRKLDGLPLAIELAATRLRILTPEMLLQRLDDRLGILDRARADAPERHRTLRAAVEWSHDMLDDDERILFRRLGAFSGGFPIDGMLAVAGESVPDPVSTLEELVTKSMVVFSLTDGEPRYRLLETLREFALERLRDSGEDDEARDRHLDWCHGIANRIQNELATPFFPDLLDVLERERYNLVAAFGWCLEGGGDIEKALDICGRLALFWDTRGFVTEGIEWTERLLEAAGAADTPGRAAALSTLGWLAMLAGDPARSKETLEESDATWRRLGDDAKLCHALAMRGMTTYNMGLLEEAEAQFAEAVELAGQYPEMEWIAEAWVPYGLAHIALARGDVPGTLEQLTKVLEYSKDNGLTWGVGHAQLSLGVLAFMGGDAAIAVERLTESLMVREQLRDARGIGDCLGIMALLASSLGDQRLAAVLLGAAQVRREASGHIPVPWMQPLLQSAVATAEEALGPDYAVAIAEGRSNASQGAGWFVERLRTLVAASSDPQQQVEI